MSGRLKTHLAIFVLLGLLLFFVAYYLLREHTVVQTFWGPLLINLGTVLAGVAIVDAVWLFLDVRRHAVMEEEGRATILARIGVREVWLGRNDPGDSRNKKFADYVSRANEIDLMGLSLATDVFDQDNNVESLFERIVYPKRTKVKVRVLVSDPSENNSITVQRLRERGEREVPHLRFLLRKTLNALEKIRAGLNNEQKSRLRVKVAHASVIYCMILRFDDQMYVSSYLTNFVGNDTPGFHIRKLAWDEECSPDGCLFDKYLKEFDCAFEAGRDFDFSTMPNIDWGDRDKLEARDDACERVGE